MTAPVHSYKIRKANTDNNKYLTFKRIILDYIIGVINFQAERRTFNVNSCGFAGGSGNDSTVSKKVSENEKGRL